MTKSARSSHIKAWYQGLENELSICCLSLFGPHKPNFRKEKGARMRINEESEKMKRGGRSDGEEGARRVNKANEKMKKLKRKWENMKDAWESIDDHLNSVSFHFLNWQFSTTIWTHHNIRFLIHGEAEVADVSPPPHPHKGRGSVENAIHSTRSSIGPLHFPK